jgi:predicted nucleotidyltransferase
MISINEIRERIAALKINPAIRKVIVFGSYARGNTSKKSDMDLVVIMETDKRFLDRYELCDQFYDIFDIGLDILPYTEAEFSRISHRPFIKRIIKEGVVVYESWEKPVRT